MKKEIETTNIDVRLSAIEPKLPNGIKKHIRKLKEEGKLSEAIKFRQREIEKKTASQRLEEKKNTNLTQLIFPANLDEQAVAARDLTLILNKTGEIDDSQKEADLFIVHKNWPEQEDALHATELSIIDEIARLSEEADRPNS